MKGLFLKSAICTWMALMLFAISSNGQQGHNFMHDLYDKINDSPTQQKFRQLAPVPAGVVYIQRPGKGRRKSESTSGP